jgi:methylthioribose-1-phosphate isomerase
LSETSRSPIEPIAYRDGVVRILDQTLLPHEVAYTDARDVATVADAIARLAVRGAPLIGIAAAYALAGAARRGEDMRAAGEKLAATRPTAVNLRWAVERMIAAGADHAEVEALRIHGEQRAADLRCGELGAALLPDGAIVLTHCNTGSLATGGIGSALGVMKTAHWQGKALRVFVDETRPLLQGARLTAWELQQEGIPHELIVDSAAAGLIARGGVHAVLVGADRIAANGDTANKVGTYALALAARAHDVPFYVVAPASTVDVATPDGRAIEVEERSADEVVRFGDSSPAPASTAARNPAFDVTPGDMITAFITERGVVRPPFDRAIAELVLEPAVSR